MSADQTKKIVAKITDWILALFGSTVVIWFVVTQPVFTSKNDINPQAGEINKLQIHVEMLSNDINEEFNKNDKYSHSAAYIYSEFQRLGNVRYEKISELANQHNNIVLELGRDTNDVFVIGAHYDSENDTLGKDNDASGVATLIELARQLSVNSNKLSLRVILVAYPYSYDQDYRLENSGSYLHALELKKSGKNVRLMVSLDSVGRFNESQGSQRHPYKFMQLFYPDKGNYINLTGRLQDFNEVRKLKQSFRNATSLPIFSQNLPESFSKAKSLDYKNYWRQGFPAVLISDTANLRKVDETLYQQRLNYRKMAMLVQGLYQVVIDTANNPNTPQVAQKNPAIHRALGLH